MPHCEKKGENEIKVETLTSETLKPISEGNRFMIMTLGCFGTVCIAVGSAFNLVSQPLQTRYQLSMRDLTTIATVGQVLKYFTLPYGIGYDHLGPIFTSVLGATVLPLGSALLSFCFLGIIDATVVRLCVFQAIFNVGCVMFDTTCIVTTVNYFPTDRGLVIAFLATYGSLGGSMVACLYNAFFAENTANYFFFLLAYSLLVGVLCVLFMKHPSYYLTGLQRRQLRPAEQEQRTRYKAQYLRQKPTMYRFIYAGCIMIFLILLLPVQGCIVAYLNLGQSYKLAFAIIVMFCAFLMLLTPFPLHRILGARTETAKPSSSPSGVSQEEPFKEIEAPPAEPTVEDLAALADDKLQGLPKVNIETDVDYIAPQYQTSFRRNLRTLHLWAMLWSLLAIVGTESTVISNASYIYGAMHEKQPTSSERAMLTAINGSCSAVGRLFMSWMEMWTQHRPAEKRIPITVSLFVASGAVLLACIFFVSLPAQAAVAPFVALAFGNGFQTASTILVIRTIYAKDLAAHYNFCMLARSIAVIICNRFLYGEWYAVQAEKMGTLLCLRQKCIFMPFMVMGGLACTSFLASLYVHVDYSRFCRRVLEERARILKEEREDTPSYHTDPDPDVEAYKDESAVVAQFYATGATEEQLEVDLQREAKQQLTP
ncbi:hypothetical protein STCU_09280 [Strigomonas culicis]|uniref:Nodulin-like domain-containing protein n=1 Tax=Strigomonas culicis TaxID=28005 RepID=S9TNG2_9TRYP|nr:hypothetical protein STCU_09280 [Strigomonas culicis]|eukprot:EPY19822.1 hypothetical protein STCU_09280 [Strigomonas culicis]